MRNYICSTGGCPAVIDHAGHCPEHERARDAARGRRQARGYDRPHERLRALHERQMAAGRVFACARCGGRIDPALPWVLDHDDSDRSKYLGPSHVSCNARAGAEKLNRNRRRDVE